MRQASRRSWRIGQTRPVKVVFMAYRNTLQADALKLVAKKLQSSLAVEGELPEDGLAAYGDDGDDLMLALARKIVSGEEEDEAETVEAVFAQARDAEADRRGVLLVDDGWKLVEVEPEAVEVHGNGASGNGHHDEAPEPQRTLFSWAEFMAEEPVKPKGRKPLARSAIPLRVGAHPGAGERGGTGRRGALDRKDTGEAIAGMAVASPDWRCMRPFLRFNRTARPCVRAFFVARNHAALPPLCHETVDKRTGVLYHSSHLNRRADKTLRRMSPACQSAGQ